MPLWTHFIRKNNQFRIRQLVKRYCKPSRSIIKRDKTKITPSAHRGALAPNASLAPVPVVVVGAAVLPAPSAASAKHKSKQTRRTDTIESIKKHDAHKKRMEATQVRNK